MSRIWLCEEPAEECPFFLEKERVNLYSFEELCYYLYRNTGALEESFFNEKLYQWLEEIGKESLSKRLRKGMEQEKSGCWCMGQILQEGEFYNSEELRSALSTAEQMEQKHPLDRAKLRGDRFLRAEKYPDAICEYRKLIAQAGQGKDRDEIVSRIWHNMGTAYARQMLFGQAADCYETAYDLGHRKEDKEAYLLALLYREGKEPENSPNRLEEVKKKLAEKKQSGDRIGYEKLVEDMLQSLRTEYRKSV